MGVKSGNEKNPRDRNGKISLSSIWLCKTEDPSSIYKHLQHAGKMI